MRRRPELVVAAVLLLGLLVAGGGAWLRSTRAIDVTSLLPPRDLFASFAGDGLGRRLADLRGLSLYRELLDLSPRGPLPSRIGWKAVPDPTALVPDAGSSVLGIYRAGWILGAREGPVTAPVIRRRDGFTVAASSPSLLESKDDGAGSASRAADPGSLRLRMLPRAFRPGGRFGALFDRWSPSEVDGTIRFSQGNLRERFVLSCPEGCILDVLDPSGDATLEGAAAAVALPNATSVAAFRLSPSALLAALGGDGGSGRGDLLSEIAQLEEFLDLPIRRDLVASLRGPGVAAVVRNPRIGDAVVIGLELRSPGAGRSLLDRIAAVGALTGSVSMVQYRGAPVVTWAGGRRLHGLEPSAAIDGDLLVLALHPSDVEEIIDRRRDGREAPPETFRNDLRALPSGPWKGATRSTSASVSWESLLRGDSAATEESPVEARAVIYRRERGWVLEGGGRSPAILADGVSPAIVKAALRAGS